MPGRLPVPLQYHTLSSSTEIQVTFLYIGELDVINQYENSSTGNLSTENSGSTVSVKLPSFWAGEPHVWFAQAEAQFVLRRITCSLTKYYHVAAVLPQEVARSVLDILQDVPSEEPYEELKSRLVQSFALTDYQRAEQFVRLPGLGDRRPSELMNTMLALLPSGHPPFFLFKYHFLQRLPADIRGHLITKKCENARDLAILADKLCVARQQDFPTASISAATGHDIDDHIDQFAVVRNLPHQRQPPRSPQPTYSDPSLCWFHSNWGSKATSCRKPCSLQAAGNGRVGWFSFRRLSRKRTYFSPNHTALPSRLPLQPPFLGQHRSLSVYPHVSSLPFSNLNLISADGGSIRSWGTKTINLQFGKRRVSWNFRLADDKYAILDADFLAKKDLLVDWVKRRTCGFP